MASNSAFISYRRATSAFIARAVFQDLRVHAIDVFMDVESIDSGQFASVILNQIAARPYFLLILTPGTLDRCNEPDDWLRREIEHAMLLERVIVPLITPSFSFESSRGFLKGKLANLEHYSGVDIPHTYFEEAMERLRKRFLKPITVELAVPPSIDQTTIEHKLEQTLAEPRITEQELLAQSYFENGLARLENDVAGKIADYSRAIELNPRFAQAYYNRGIALFGQGDYSGAIGDFTMAISLNPHDSDSYSNRGFARALLNNNKAAIDDCNEAIRLNPQDPQAYLGRAIAYALESDFSRTLSDLDRAISLDKQVADVLAQVDYKRFNPNDPLIMGDLMTGLNHLRQAFACGFGDIDSAIAHINEAIAVHPLIGQILAQAELSRGKSSGQQKRKSFWKNS